MHRLVGIAASCLACLFFAAAVYAWAPARKAGLWEMTTNMTWQQSPFPGGTPPPAAAAAFGGGPRTTQVCLTQAMIDKYGAPVPQGRGDCQVSNVKLSDHGMTADMVCTGRMGGNATVESSWTDDEHATGKVHFTGTLQAGPSPKPIEWTINSTSVYKGADCGNVKPIEPSSK